jgi:ligand-binding sensor domain-containing protein/signal transduction histidine kinase
MMALAGAAFGLDPQKSLSQYGHRSWQTDSGLPQNTVHAVLQTRDGYVWLATEGGLVRFDGVEFVVYDKEAPARLPSASINCLFQSTAPEGTSDLWVGTEDGLLRRDGDRFSTFGVVDGLPSNTIWSVFQDRSGSLWVVTPEGLARYRNGRFQAFPLADGIATPRSVAEAPDGSFWIGTRAGLVHFDARNGEIQGRQVPVRSGIQAVAATLDGKIWIGSRGGLESFDPAKTQYPAAFAGLPSNEIASLTNDRDGSLWVGTAKGVAVIPVVAGQGPSGPLTIYSTQTGLPGDRVQSTYQDREGAMWIATNRGIARIFQGHAEIFGAREGVADSQVLSLFEDREGSLWIGTESSGLDMVHDQKFTSYTTADGLSGDLVRAVIQVQDGSMWIGTNGGGLDRFDHGRFSSLTTKEGLASDIVLALGSGPAGDLWVGTPDGLDRLHEGKITSFTSADGLADDFVRSIYAASDGSMWIGTRRGLSHLQYGRFTNYSSMDGLGSDLVGAIAEDRDHSLWIGTLGGLTHLAHGKFTTLTTREGISSNVVTALYADSKGSLWIGTAGGGLDRLTGDRITTYSPSKTRLPESIYAILEDAIGNLWLASRTGIYRVPKEDLNRYAENTSSPIEPTVYGTADGMKIGEASSGGHPAAWKLTDGTMWFATLRGVAAVDPEHLARNMVPPPVAIDQVLIDDTPVANRGPLTVAPGISRFEFHYAGLSFIAPQKVHFRYKLTGFDRDWIDAGTRRTAYYTNLPPGRYSFRVLACNNDGVWNESGAVVEFRLRPHFYQNYWFYFAVLIGLGLMIYQAYRWRVREVELRFDAVLSERGRIAREIHDTLAQSLVGIAVQLELVNRLLASSIDNARAQLDHTRALVRDSIAEARSSIWDLRSQAAETQDLATRLSEMAAKSTAGAMPKIKVKSRISGTYRPIAPKIEAELLRIAQEAVANAVRHAAPSQIEITLRFSARDLQMSVQDDGRGFDGQPHPQSSGPEGHFGLAGMRERAEEIGATLLVDSRPGKGTQVSVQVAIDG